MASGSRRRGRVFIYIALILILALVLIWALVKLAPGGFSIGGSAPTQAPVEEMVNIVVTTQQVQRGTEFTEAVLTTIPYPKKNFDQATFFTNIADVVGKKAKIDLEPKVPLTSSLVIDKTQGSFAAFQIPKGMVAVSIPVTRLSSVSFAPQAGDHVNLIVTMTFLDLDTNFQSVLPNNTSGVIAPGTDLSSGTGSADSKSSSIQPVHQNIVAQLVYGGSGSMVGRAEIDTGLSQPLYVVPSEAQRPRMVSQTLLQDAVILQVGSFETAADRAAAQQVGAPTPVPGAVSATAVPVTVKPPDVVTLVVAPQDAITLNYLMFNNAELTMALRGAGDDQRVQTDAVTLQYLMDQYNIPVPAKLPYGVDQSAAALPVPVLTNDQPTPAPR